ncbi:MAG: efflux RND transporter periplasmic adaptor subunit [Alphaproteobacteria bacterium]|nr:MAG: efflux RND transporter periplasmic adaptor subunit [Alphaproteobacteria bacterium]
MPRARRWIWWLITIGAISVGYAGWQHVRVAGAVVSASQHPSQSPAPIHVAPVERTDFPVVLNGLGTVQATNTVTVRSRVDGQIEKVGFEEGQMVREGDLLVQIDPAPFQATLNQAIAKLAQDQASLTNGKQDLERTTILSRQGNATQQLLDQRTANVASLTAQVQADQAAIDSARVQLAYTTIKSPLTGRAGFRLVDPGNIVHANDQTGILTITQLQPISVVFTAPEQQLPAINDALASGPLKVTAYSSDGKRRLGEGTLKLLDNQVDPASGTIRLKASFDNPDNALWPGLSVTTRLLVRTLKDVVVVPDAAVQRGPNGLYAYVVTPASSAELRDIKVGQIEGGLALVEQGLSPGERIVTSGHYRVQPGGSVQVLDGQQRRTTAQKVE